MKTSKILFFIIGIVIFLLIIYGIGLDKLVLTLKNFNFYYLPVIFILFLLSYILAALNTWVIGYGFKKISLFYTIKATFINLVYATIIPGKIADLLMIPLLKKEKLSFNQATVTLFLDKAISLFIKLIFALFGIIFLVKRNVLLFSNKTFISVSILILSIFLFVLIIKSKFILSFIKNKILRRYLLFLRKFYKTLKKYIKINKKNLFYNAIITIFKAFIESSLFFFLFLSFGQKASFIEVFLIFSLLSIIVLLASPIFGISGLGVREVTGIFMFSLIKIDSAVVFNSFILKLILLYIVDLFIVARYRKELHIIKFKGYLKKLKSFSRNKK